MGWIGELPAPLLKGILQGCYPNINLVKLKDSIMFNPKAEDVKANILFLRPVCKKFPADMPASYFLADSMILFDALLHNRLFLSGKIDADAAKQKTIVTDTMREFKADRAQSEVIGMALHMAFQGIQRGVMGGRAFGGT